MNKAHCSRQETLDRFAEISKARGLIFLGPAPLDVSADYQRMERWLSEGRQAGMEFLEKNREVRANPKKLLPDAKAALVFGLPYNSGDRWHRAANATPRIAMYSKLRDYHKVLKRDLTEIYESMIADGFLERHQLFRVTVDSAPLLERAVAAGTRQGFIGKNTCYIHPQHGSLMLLGEILTTWAADQEDLPHSVSSHLPRTGTGGCGTCRRCQVHCPTGALDQEYRIDARKCLSWWTIENRGTIPREFWPWIGEYLFGCDICQLVCPWNRNQPIHPRTIELTAIKTNIDSYEIATMDQKKYSELFGGTPVTRAKREGLIRNALIAMHVRNDSRLKDAILRLDSETHPTIRETILMIREDFYRSRKS